MSVFNGTPAHFILLTDRLDAGRDDVSSLRIGVGTAAAFPAPLLRRIFTDLGMDLLLMYGSSEGVGVMTTDREEMLSGSVGKPYYPGFVSIVGPDHEPLPEGEIGEIAFNRAWVPVRYWNEGDKRPTAPVRPEHPEAEPDWFYSGDIGRFDDGGRLHVLGRLKHQVDRGGIKVDPGEVEAVLLRCPEVTDAAVIGTPNPVLGENVCACIVTAEGRTLTLAALRQELGSSLAPHKLPEELCLLPTIPRTALGKVDRARLREQVLADDARERLRER